MTNDVQPLFWRGLLIVGLSALLPIAAMADNAPLVVTKLDGTQHQGELVAWNAAELSLQTEDQTITLASANLLRAEWQHNSPDETSEKIFVELVDGTRLPHQSYEVEQGQATISTTLASDALTLATDRIAYVQLAQEAPTREQLAGEQEGDVLIVRKKKAGAFDHLTGILGDVSSEQVKFTWDGEAIPVKRSKVAALAYFHARTPVVQESVCWLNLRGGGRLPMVEISAEGRNLQVRTSGGIELSFGLELLRDADYSQGKLAYLSDLRPIEQRWTPRIDLPKSAELIRQHGLPRRDQSYAGSALTLQWPPKKRGAFEGEIKTYTKGLAMRSRTECRYRLPTGMRRFIALAGIDPETASEGNLTLEIFADRRSVWQGEIDRVATPTEIDVALGDARELRLVVDYGKNLDFGDRLHLVEARLSQ